MRMQSAFSVELVNPRRRNFTRMSQGAQYT